MIKKSQKTIYNNKTNKNIYTLFSLLLLLTRKEKH